MAQYKSLIPCLYLKEGKAVSGFDRETVFESGDAIQLAMHYGNHGADEILVFDLSEGDTAHEEAIGWIKKISQKAEVPVIGAGHIKRMEDVKKLLYAGCEKAVLNFAKESNISILEEVSTKFGKDKILVNLFSSSQYNQNQDVIESLAGGILCTPQVAESIMEKTQLPILLYSQEMDETTILNYLKTNLAEGITGDFISSASCDCMEFKKLCLENQISVNTFSSSIAWSEFKLNSDGMIPVVVQDYKTDEVLMLAYMNEEAFQATLESGRMTYWSRSRNELWEKGLTSGHFQYVKSLHIDCDRDTLLAKVSQVGAACHTGNYSCFYTELAKKPYDDTNPLHVFQNVYDVIMDRKLHPKEGSYTNYLFDKGVDKILKKVGEECTEIVIAAKNPDPEEIKYEISDFLYHVMVLMADKGVTWEDITRELARR